MEKKKEDENRIDLRNNIETRRADAIKTSEEIASIRSPNSRANNRSFLRHQKFATLYDQRIVCHPYPCLMLLRCYRNGEACTSIIFEISLQSEVPQLGTIHFVLQRENESSSLKIDISPYRYAFILVIVLKGFELGKYLPKILYLEGLNQRLRTDVDAMSNRPEN